ncbi:phosphatase 2C-like domain-containing protein [Mycena galopus ATCC 62051]|nr:phosphatase 2C-like domain-containing protein [Mycena galopus ATCC 62051]
MALGLSASIYLATLNNVYGDSDESVPSSENIPDPVPNAGFIVDSSQWFLPTRYLGDPSADGILRIYWLSRFDTRVRIVTHAPRTLITLFEGEFATRGCVADFVADNLWAAVEAVYRWYQTDPTSPQPVEFMHEPPPPEVIKPAIKSAIMATDERLVTHFLGPLFSSLSKKNIPEAYGVVSSSCLVSALYEADTQLLHVTSLGNMRALLGRKSEDGTNYDVHVLSVPHTADNPAEISRIESLHPGENVVKDGWLFGRPYTRALGDAKLKWSPDVQTRLHNDYLGPIPAENVKTPPYISAEPDVNTIKVMPGDFLVLSSQWLAESLTDEEVVGLTGAWLDKNRDFGLYLPVDQVDSSDPTPAEVIMPDALPVNLKDDKTVMYRRWKTPKRFVNVGYNPTTHLMNNAMGGANSDLREALLELTPSESEGNTKSLGIVVVFFK